MYYVFYSFIFKIHLHFRGHKDVIYNLEWNPYEVNKFASVGVKHIKFWTIIGKLLYVNCVNVVCTIVCMLYVQLCVCCMYNCMFFSIIYKCKLCVCCMYNCMSFSIIYLFLTSY